MSFFRDYLTGQNQKPDLRFQEADENLFVFALLFLRLGFRINMWNLVTGRGRQFLKTDPFAGVLPGLEFNNALQFVSTFLCFFVPKPPSYEEEMSSFKDFFVPGFAKDLKRQQLLFESALPSFSTTPLREAKWETVADYFHPWT